MDKLTLACQQLGLDPALVIKSREDSLLDAFFVLVDYGIGGVKKYSVSLSALQEPEPQEETQAPEPLPAKKGRKAGK